MGTDRTLLHVTHLVQTGHKCLWQLLALAGAALSPEL